jgi:hypothetical protein
MVCYNIIGYLTWIILFVNLFNLKIFNIAPSYIVNDIWDFQNNGLNRIKIQASICTLIYIWLTIAVLECWIKYNLIGALFFMLELLEKGKKHGH